MHFVHMNAIYPLCFLCRLILDALVVRGRAGRAILPREKQTRLGHGGLFGKMCIHGFVLV